MIIPVEEDGLCPVWYSDTSGAIVLSFSLYVDDIEYSVFFNDACPEVPRSWCFWVKLGPERRSITDSLPTDSVAQSVCDLLNKQESTAGMVILEYLTNMGFNVAHRDRWGRFKMFCRRLFGSP